MNPTDPAAIQQNAYTQLRDAVVGSGLSSPVVSNYFAPERNAATSALASAAPNYNTGVTVANQEAAAKEARANQIDQLKAQYQAEKDANDPSKFQRIPKQDGGFAFVDPQGKEITAADYARVKGIDTSQAVKGSQNPIDIAFAQDYKQLNQYIHDKQNAKTDPKAKARAQAVEAQVHKLYNIKLHQQNPQEVTNALTAAYPTIFGGTAAGRQKDSALLPNNNALKKSSHSVGAPGL